MTVVLVVLISAIGTFVALVVLLAAVCAGIHQEAERLTGRAPTRLAATARRATGLHVITPAPPALLRDVRPLSRIQAGSRAPTPEPRSGRRTRRCRASQGTGQEAH